MKKNITINLFGQLYNIDEDAYELLNSYEESLRAHFKKQTDGTEIFNDLEARIAELLNELKAQHIEAITIEHIQDIIKRIGAPEEIDSEEDSGDDSTQADATSKEKGKKQKRLFRDEENKMVAGVLAGFANFFGHDVLYWRFGYVILFLLSLFNGNSIAGNMLIALIIAYVACAVLMPAAKTPADRLKMKGQEVTPETLAMELSSEVNKNDKAPKAGARENVKGCIIGFLGVIGLLIHFSLMALGLLLFIPALGAIIVGAVIGGTGGSAFETVFDNENALMIYQNMPILIWTILISVFLLCFCPAYCAVHSLLVSTKKIEPMGWGQRVAWFVLWLIALVAVVAASANTAQRVEKIEQLSEENYRTAHLHNGIFIRERDWLYLQENRWKIVKAENCNDRYTEEGEYFNGNDNMRYLNVYNNDCLARFQVERIDSVANGLYRLKAKARAQGNGVYIYAVGDETVMTEVTPCGNEGGKLWDEAQKETTKADSTAITTATRMIAEANDGKGYGWSEVECTVKVSNGTVSYGVSTDPQFTHHPYSSEWFSAADFSLERIK